MTHSALMPDVLVALLKVPRLIVRQVKELAEIIVDWETRNRYEIVNEGSVRLAAIVEQGGGLSAFFRRGLLRSHRGFTIHILDSVGTPLALLERSFFFFFSSLKISTAEGQKVGSVRRRFGVLHRRYDLEDAHGQVLARINSPLWHLWTFPVESLRMGAGSGVITKKWSGLLQEVFTDADNYCVDFGSLADSWQLRLVVLAAAISIDFDFFEKNQRKGGIGRGLFAS